MTISVSVVTRDVMSGMDSQTLAAWLKSSYEDPSKLPNKEKEQMADVAIQIEPEDFKAGNATSTVIPHRGPSNSLSLTVRQRWTSRSRGYFYWAVKVGDLEVARCDGSATKDDVELTIFGVTEADSVSFWLVPLKNQIGRASWSRASKSLIRGVETSSIGALPSGVALYAVASCNAVEVKSYTTAELDEIGGWRDGLDTTLPSRQEVNANERCPESAINDYRMLRRGELLLKPHKPVRMDPFDWQRSENRDNNWHFQHHTLRFLNPVRHLAQRGNEHARRYWLEGVRTWSELHGNPEKSPSNWAWVDMVDGLRAIQLSLGASLAGPNDAWFRRLLVGHRDWLLNEDNLRPRNHGMHQRAGLFVVSCALKDESAKQTAVTWLYELFWETFHTEGTDDEGAPAYLLYNIKWWTQVLRRLTAEGVEIPKEINESLVRSKRILKLLETPSGKLPPIGDTSFTARIPNRIEGEPFFSDADLKTLEFDNLSVLDAGYVVMRDDKNYALIRFGEPGKGHHHHDKGSVIISDGLTDWLTDPGFYGYQSKNTMRQRTLSRSAHNVFEVEGFKGEKLAPVHLEDADDGSDSMTVKLVGDSVDDVDGLSVHRVVQRTRAAQEWRVIDWFTAKRAERREVRQHWLVAPGIDVQQASGVIHLHTKDTKMMLIPSVGNKSRVAIQVVKATSSSEVGWVGCGYGKRRPGTQITVSTTLLPGDELSLIVSRVENSVKNKE